MEKGQLKTVALLSLLSGLLVVIGYVLYGTAGALLGLGIAAVTNFGSWFYSDQIALRAYKAQPVTRAQMPEVYSMVERLAAKADIPMPGVYLVPGAAANAFATGRNPEHAAATSGGAIAFLAQMLQYSLFFGGSCDRQGNGANPIALIATIFLAPLAATDIQMGISRTREYAADAGAARLTSNPRAPQMIASLAC